MIADIAMKHETELLLYMGAWVEKYFASLN